MKPRLVDLYSGAGGAARGYQRAGFYVVGVDIAPQPNYAGDEFIQDDAIGFLRTMQGREDWNFDAIHASPPCQAYTHMNQRHAEARAGNPALIHRTRELLEATGLPYVIENVPGAAFSLISPTRLCGRSFGLPISRHRYFETTFPLMAYPCHHSDEEPFGIYGKLDGRRLITRANGSEYRAAKTLEEASRAMGIDWMTWNELREAIPPAMTEHVGLYLMNHLKAEVAA